MGISKQLEQFLYTEIPRMEGWCTPERAIEMATLISNTKPDVCIEIGVFGGRSLMAQAMALRENGKGIIYGIDPYKKEAAYEGENQANRDWYAALDIHLIHRLCVEQIWRHDLDKWAHLLRAASQDIHYLFQNESVDILEIDGNHSEIASTRDVNLYLPKVKVGGYVWFDDTDWPSTKSALALLNEWCEIVQGDDHHRLYKKVRKIPLASNIG